MGYQMSLGPRLSVHVLARVCPDGGQHRQMIAFAPVEIPSGRLGGFLLFFGGRIEEDVFDAQAGNNVDYIK